MKIVAVRAYNLVDIPIQPPPFRDEPSTISMRMLEIETDEGITGWAMGSHAHPIMVDFVTQHLGPALVGRDPLAIERIWDQIVHQPLDSGLGERRLGRVLTSAMSTVDIALWDIKGKVLGQPVHRLLGGAADTVPVYVTHGAAYRGVPPYTPDELAEEAKHLADLGIRRLKIPVGRQVNHGQFAPDPADDYRRIAAVRQAVGPDVSVAVDGSARMTLAEATRLCKLLEELDVWFLEEPVQENDPAMLAALRQRTSIPLAAAENHRFRVRAYIEADAVDIVQPNVANDGGYTGAARIAAVAKTFNKSLGQGNGAGPHNTALQAGVTTRGIVEYHYHYWMAYNALFKEVPQPVGGELRVSQAPGLGLEPKDGVIEEHATRHQLASPGSL